MNGREGGEEKLIFNLNIFGSFVSKFLKSKRINSYHSVLELCERVPCRYLNQPKLGYKKKFF